MKFLLNIPRKLLANLINVLIAIPFVFVGLLFRALAEWLIADNAKKSVKPEVQMTLDEMTDTLILMEALLEEKEKQLKKVENSEISDLTHLTEEELAEYFEDEDNDNTNIH